MTSTKQDSTGELVCIRVAGESYYAWTTWPCGMNVSRETYLWAIERRLRWAAERGELGTA